MTKLLLHIDSRQQLDQFIDKPSHALMIIGPAGSGKFTTAAHLTSQILQADEDGLTNSTKILIIKPTGQTISIDQIRQLQAFVKLKTFGAQPIRRAVIIKDADNMTTEAQNALLKLLEEPPEDTLIVLTVTQTNALLPTITSRVQKINMKLSHKRDLLKYFDGLGHKAKDVEQAYYLSEGLVGKMSQLLKPDTDSNFSEQINTAKQILQMTTFERLGAVSELSKQEKPALGELLAAFEVIASSALRQVARKNDALATKRWQQILKSVMSARSDLAKNANSKLLLTDLLLNI